MPTKLYLLNLSGGGDTQLTLVDKETWEWIGSPWPFGANSDGGVDPNTPTRITTIRETDDPGNGDVFITSGSWENDRALVASLCGAEFNGQPIETFRTVKALNKFMKDNDIEIEEEYEGYIY
jgi:hypothetical protein